jgi:nucleoid DNA-binding protein
MTARRNLTKRHIVQAVADGRGRPASLVGEIFDDALHYMAAALARGEAIELRGFASFRPCPRAPRLVRNPNVPGSEFIYPASTVIRVRIGRTTLRALHKRATPSDL